MALGRGPGLEERCVFTYHALPIGSVAPAVEERFVTAMFDLDLGLRRLGLVGAELKFSGTAGTQLVTEVFVDRLEVKEQVAVRRADLARVEALGGLP